MAFHFVTVCSILNFQIKYWNYISDYANKGGEKDWIFVFLYYHLKSFDIWINVVVIIASVILLSAYHGNKTDNCIDDNLMETAKFLI